MPFFVRQIPSEPTHDAFPNPLVSWGGDPWNIFCGFQGLFPGLQQGIYTPQSSCWPWRRCRDCVQIREGWKGRGANSFLAAGPEMWTHTTDYFAVNNTRCTKYDGWFAVVLRAITVLSLYGFHVIWKWHRNCIVTVLMPLTTSVCIQAHSVWTSNCVRHPADTETDNNDALSPRLADNTSQTEHRRQTKISKKMKTKSRQ